MWREPSCQPLYASGAELTRRQGDAPGDAPLEGRSRAEWDFPTWLDATRRLLAEPAFDALADEEQVARLFGSSSPAADLSRYCSLNLRRLTTYGTLEVRRFHCLG